MPLVTPALYAQFGRWFMPTTKRANLETVLSNDESMEAATQKHTAVN